VDGSTVTLTGSADTTADSEKIALAVGNTQGVTKVVNNIAVATPQTGSGFYTVKSGDSLWKIAEAAYGHGMGEISGNFRRQQAVAEGPGQDLPWPGASHPASR